MKNRLTASEVIKILQKKIKEHGDLEIVVNTQDGGCYGLYDEDDIHHEVWTNRDGDEFHKISIG